MQTITLPWGALASDNLRKSIVSDKEAWRTYSTAREAARAIAGEQWQGAPLTGYVAVTITLYPPDRRRRDAANLLKMLCDALTGIAYIDDSMIDALGIRRRPLDRVNPRAEVTIEPIRNREGHGE